MPLVATRGAASAQGFGEFARVTPPIYIEDVFSTYLYTGTGSSQTITNGIDLSGKGGMVWLKSRNNPDSHYIVDTARGSNKVIYSNLTIAEETLTRFSSFNSNGFSLSTTPSNPNVNGYTYASWTFREQPKFFDIVTYTGDGASSKSVSHNLGSTPGCVIVKRTDSTSFWLVWHRGFSSPSVSYGYLNSTDPFQPDSPNNNWAAAPTSTTFTPASNYNVNGATYVAYLFAHNAGGFGLTGTDNVISCGSFQANSGATITVNLGYEPQWMLTKNVTTAGNDWQLVDNMRGWGVDASSNNTLQPNTSAAENVGTSTGGRLTSTGVQFFGFGGTDTYIYIAIRRGPMKTPTSGTSVFSPNATTATTGTVITPNFPVDAQIIQYRTPAGGNVLWQDRLRGVNTTTTENNNPVLTSNDTSAESSTFASTRAWSNTGFQIASALTGQNRIYWSFGRAPGFFDEVCYTGTTADNTQTHNLSAVPELIIIKRRNAAQSWAVFNSFTSTQLTRSFLNFDSAATTYLYTDNVGVKQQPTSTQFVLNGANTFVNVNAGTYVAYLFATVAGVSKVGSYTGTGALQTINCGFASGARFVLIKRTDSTGDWYVWDSARGISSSTDPYLTLNTTAAEVTSTNWVDTASTGFQVTAAGGNLVNTNGGTYIFLAIA